MTNDNETNFKKADIPHLQSQIVAVGQKLSIFYKLAHLLNIITYYCKYIVIPRSHRNRCTDPHPFQGDELVRIT